MSIHPGAGRPDPSWLAGQGAESTTVPSADSAWLIPASDEFAPTTTLIVTSEGNRLFVSSDGDLQSTSAIASAALDVLNG
jgi:hypothetical protein